MNEYQFSNTWFNNTARAIWEQLIPQVSPGKILEVGSYEGASLCFMVNALRHMSDLEIHCIDTWEGGIEHQGFDMGSVESRFRHNVNLAMSHTTTKVSVHLHKGYSDHAMASLLAAGKKNYFDFVYVDGSHQAPDALCDAVLGFRLLKVGGIMAFDDYLWAEELPGGKDLLRCAKPAIDAFTNLYCRKLQILAIPPSQVWIKKTSD